VLLTHWLLLVPAPLSRHLAHHTHRRVASQCRRVNMRHHHLTVQRRCSIDSEVTRRLHLRRHTLRLAARRRGSGTMPIPPPHPRTAAPGSRRHTLLCVHRLAVRHSSSGVQPRCRSCITTRCRIVAEAACRCTCAADAPSHRKCHASHLVASTVGTLGSSDPRWLAMCAAADSHRSKSGAVASAIKKECAALRHLRAIAPHHTSIPLRDPAHACAKRKGMHMLYRCAAATILSNPAALAS